MKSAASSDEPDLKTMDRILGTAKKAAHRAGEIMRNENGATVIETKYNAKDLLTKVDGMCQEVIQKEVESEFGSESHSFLGEESVGSGAEASKRALREALDKSDFVWIVDPIDGTTNFVHSMPLSAVSIGVTYRGKIVVGCIYDPFADEMFSAIIGKGSFMNGNPIKVGAQSEIGAALVAAGSPPNLLNLAPSLRGIKALAPKVRSIRMLGSAAVMLAWVACGRLTAYFEPDLNAWDVCAGALLVSEAGGEMSDCKGKCYNIFSRRILASNGKVHKSIVDILISANATEPDQLA